MSGSVQGLRCGNDAIELEKNDILDPQLVTDRHGSLYQIVTKDYGAINFALGALNSTGFVAYLTSGQEELLRRYVRD